MLFSQTYLQVSQSTGEEREAASACEQHMFRNVGTCVEVMIMTL